MKYSVYILIKPTKKNGSGQSFLLTRCPFLKTVDICGGALQYLKSSNWWQQLKISVRNS